MKYIKASAHIPANDTITITIKGLYPQQDGIPNIYCYPDDDNCAKDLISYLKENGVDTKINSVGLDYTHIVIDAKYRQLAENWINLNEVKLF